MACCALLIACGGGGGSSSRATPSTPVTPPASDFDQGIFRDSSVYANACAVPRGEGSADVQGTAEDENNWLRAWSHDLYLWYGEIVDEDPAAYGTTAYFDLMKTFALTPRGRPKDKFHFTYDTEEWQQLSQSGIAAGYGADIQLLQPAPPREVVVAYVEAGSQAAAAGLKRGTRILFVDGIDVINDGTQAGTAALNAALFPADVGATHAFEITDFDGSNPRTVELTSARITQNPVPITSIGVEPAVSNAPVPSTGYLLFNSHIATAEQRLLLAVESFAAANVQELVVDLRYNGGGFLDIANELAYMIAGPNATQNTFFGETQFNDKHTNVNPVTGQDLQPEPFHSTAQGYSVAAGTPLPSLGLPRVFILTSGGTCSASEAVINALRGIGIAVILIGDTTCGKPYGFYPKDNCGTTYFSIQFRSVNNAGFGDYADGFIPTIQPVEAFEVTGCRVDDDFSRALGDPQEALLATALGYIAEDSCPQASAGTTRAGKSVGIGSMGATQTTVDQSGSRLIKPPRMPGTVR